MYPAPDLAAALGYPNPDFDVWSYATRNLGAVEVDVGEDETIVTMRSATAHPEAVRAAEAFLKTLEGGPVRLRYEIGTWIEETCDTAQQAIGRMTGALAIAARESRRIAFMCKARKLDMLAHYRLNHVETTEERFSLLFKKWRLNQGKFDSDLASFLVRFGLVDRTAIVSESNSKELVFEHFGVGFRAYDSYDKAFPFNAPGTPIAEQPDPDYGRWLDRVYHNVLDQGEPRFEYVDAVIQARSGEPYRSRYDRLLLPWQSAEGQRIITGTSFQAPVYAAAAP